MDYNVENEGNVARLRLSGQLTFEDHPGFRDVLALAAEMRNGQLVLDLAGLDFIDSSGLGMFALLKEAADNNNITLSMRGARGLVLRLLTLVKFDAIIPFSND
ncbi:MAG: STAS domain-containing protein [Rhodospirillaceae bacterium]